MIRRSAVNIKFASRRHVGAVDLLCDLPSRVPAVKPPPSARANQPISEAETSRAGRIRPHVDLRYVAGRCQTPFVGVTERDSAVQTSRSDVGVDTLLRIHDRKRSELVARLGHLAVRKNAPAPRGYEVIS